MKNMPFFFQTPETPSSFFFLSNETKTE